MTLWLDDGDVRLYHGDALEQLALMPSESVQCIVTSPPFWGLRDYGTGSWTGGDPDCDHRHDTAGGDRHGRYLAGYVRPETGKPTGGSQKKRAEASVLLDAAKGHVEGAAAVLAQPVLAVARAVCRQALSSFSPCFHPPILPLNAEYLEIAAKRLQQLSLLGGHA